MVWTTIAGLRDFPCFGLHLKYGKANRIVSPVHVLEYHTINHKALTSESIRKPIALRTISI